ncbi:MAG: hypothetical protein JWO06_3549 [Bacteroidota bacterium]|nr:hypothetical protein [Bacteroidota bacterium]
MKFILLYSSVIFNVLTNVGFNLSAIHENEPVKRWGYFAGGLVFGLINSYLFTECLRAKVPLQTASAIFFSLTIIGLFLFGHFYFKETITPLGMVGAVLIIIGVIIVSTNSEIKIGS